MLTDNDKTSINHKKMVNEPIEKSEAIKMESLKKQNNEISYC